MHCCKKNAAKSRSVLILAYGWPPDASVGAVRPVYLSRQVGRLGWHPIVITVHEQYHERLNTSIFVDIFSQVKEYTELLTRY